ncbi:MAG: response regulator transcription factor [Burkholderiaceae bacterium]|jgi:DNA-binding NarL/FixJ family response regulator
MLIFVVDDHPLMREAVVMLFRRIKSACTIVEMDRVGAIAQNVAIHGTPEMICLDLKLPDTHGVSGVREVRAAYPKVPLVVLSASPASDYEDLAIEAGADLYLEKSAGATHLSQSLRALVTPESDFGEGPAENEKLSKRQKQLLKLLDDGLSNRDIAEQLGISEHTVKVHLWRLFRRLDVKSRTQATYWARSHGIV